MQRRLPAVLRPAAKSLYRAAWRAADPLLSDAAYVHLRYLLQFGRAPDLARPLTLNEKVLWRRLYDRRSLLVELSDKVAVRRLVAVRAGVEHLVESHGVFESAEEIPWSTLPRSYVVKATHGSGWVRVVDDGRAVDRGRLVAEAEDWLNTDYSTLWRERQYRPIPRRLIIERRLGAAGEDLIDYKVFCFDGVPAVVLTGYHLLSRPATAFYDTKWRRLPFTWSRPVAPPTPRPALLEEMLDVAARMARGLDFVRVDLLCDDGGVYVGEMTITPNGGFLPIVPRRYDEWLGSLWTLPGDRG